MLPPFETALRASSVYMSGKVTGPAPCDNEGCAGWAGAEPQAWGTGHEEGYAFRWAGHRQEVHRRGRGRAVATRRGSLLGSNGERAGVGRPIGQEAGSGQPRAGGVLRGGT